MGMKIIVAVCVYNRYENIKKWITAWNQRELFEEEAVWPEIFERELIIIHNFNGDERIKQICEGANVSYVRRPNVGFDMGCVQDIFKERLPGVSNNWDYILWCADDTIPVRKDFLQQYVNTIILPDCGCACMKISPHQTLHVRTSGWMISKETSRKIQFPADPITTKMHCYQMEHKGGRLNLINQIRELGLDVRQVAKDSVAPLWDSGYWRRLNRGHEFYEAFGVQNGYNDKVVVIATVYNSDPAPIIAAMKMQTHKNWELVLIHDGKADFENGLELKMISERENGNIKIIETPERQGKYGHPNRKWALENLDKLSDASYVVITNSDNYYPPVFLEYMLKGFQKSHTAVATYCDAMIHSYKAWQQIPVRFEKGFIDCGGVMVKREVAMEVGWRDTESHSADWTYFSDIAARYNKKSFIPVRGCLLTHN